MITTESRREIVANAFRWATNMIVEVISNHGGAFSLETRDVFRSVSTALSDAESAIRREMRGGSAVLPVVR